WMWRLTSSDPEIDSLIAVPSSRRSCFILSSTLVFRPWPPRSSTVARARSILRPQTALHAAPQLSPVREILPAAPPCITPQHGRVFHRVALVVGLPDEPPELAVDG